MTSPVPLLLFALAVQFAAPTPGAIAQSSDAVCLGGYDWMTNAKGQNPCLAAAWLLSPCNNPANSIVVKLPTDTSYYLGPRAGSSSIPCKCNTVFFSLLAGCATCQGGASHIKPWPVFSANCTDPTIADYPENIPGGTSVPVWAYQDVTVNSTWNAETAKAMAGENKTPSASSTSDASYSSGTQAPGSGNGGDDETGTTGSGKEKKSSKVGPIVGGVVVGIAGAAAIAFGIFFYLRRRQTGPRDTVDLDENYYHDDLMHEPMPPQVLTPFVAAPPRNSPAAHSTVYADNAVLANAPMEVGSSSGSGHGGGAGVHRTGKAAYVYEAIPPPAYNEVGTQ